MVIEIRGKSKPPAPPPRSSTTRLSTDAVRTPAAVDQDRDSNRKSSPGDALDSLIYNSNEVRVFRGGSVTKIGGGNPVAPVQIPALAPNRPPKPKPKPVQLKKVKFHPQVDSKKSGENFSDVHLGSDSDLGSKSVKPLDPNFLHFIPKLTNTGPDKKTSGISYIEPYL